MSYGAVKITAFCPGWCNHPGCNRTVNKHNLAVNTRPFEMCNTHGAYMTIVCNTQCVYIDMYLCPGQSLSYVIQKLKAETLNLARMESANELAWS